MLHYFYEEELLQLYPNDSQHAAAHSKIFEDLNRYPKSKTIASRTALLLEQELEWIATGEIDEIQKHNIVITKAGKQALLNGKYKVQSEKELLAKVNFWMMLLTQVGVIAIAIYITYTAINETQSLKGEIKQVEKRQLELEQIVLPKYNSDSIPTNH